MPWGAFVHGTEKDIAEGMENGVISGNLNFYAGYLPLAPANSVIPALTKLLQFLMSALTASLEPSGISAGPSKELFTHL